MKYFIDTEFIEGFHKPLFGKKRHFIDLISIGIVCEDGREYYAISNEYNPKDADEWVKKNVILPLYQNSLSGDIKNRLTPKNFHKHIGKSNKQISEEIKEFVDLQRITASYKGEDAEFYAYYADYDWVLFCSLFGRMIDLPKGFPMYCNDLKQIFDGKIYNRIVNSDKLNAFSNELDELKSRSDYPKQENEHNAIDDARWNKKLYDFLKQL